MKELSDRIGVSTACKYPLITEDSLRWACGLGFKTVEVFLNSPSETTDGFIDGLKAISDESGIDIVSVHPFTSLYESYYLFTDYERRFYDALPSFESYIRAASRLGAKYFVLHGAKIKGSADVDTVCRRYSRLSDIADKYGVRICQENVVLHRAEAPEYLIEMRKRLGEDLAVVLDIKQAYRAGRDVSEFIDKLHDNIVHVHVSDRNAERDCIPPSEGIFDFDAFFSLLDSAGYKGKYIIELYNSGFERDDQIISAGHYLSDLIQKYD